MHQKGFANIIVVIAIVIITAIAGYFILSKKQSSFPPYSVNSDNILTTNIDGYFETCMDNTTIYKRLNGNWVKVSNKLPDKGLYYLEDKFSGYGMCDLITCTELPKPYTLKLVEYKKVSEKAPPQDSGSTVNVLPVYQTIPLRGDVKVDVQYFSDKDCRNKETISTIIKR